MKVGEDCKRFFAITFMETDDSPAVQINTSTEGYSELEKIALLEMFKTNLILNGTHTEKVDREDT